MMKHKIFIKLFFVVVFVFIGSFLFAQKVDAATQGFGWAWAANDQPGGCPFPWAQIRIRLYDEWANPLSGGSAFANGAPVLNPSAGCYDPYGSLTVSASRSGYQNFWSEFSLATSVANRARGRLLNINVYLTNTPSIEIISVTGGSFPSSPDFRIRTRDLPALSELGVGQLYARVNGGWSVIASNQSFGDIVRNLGLGPGTYNIGFEFNTRDNPATGVLDIAVSAYAGDVTITVLPAGEPDLVVRNLSSGTSPPIHGPTTRACGQSGDWGMRTRNIGSASAGTSKMRVTAVGSTNVSDVFSVGSLNPSTSGGQELFTTTWNTAGVKTIRTYADSDSDVSESNESNNDDATLNVTVTCPDVNVTVVVFVDKDGDGIKDGGEQFASSGNPSFSAGVATITQNSNDGTAATNITNLLGSDGINTFPRTLGKWYQYQVAPQGDWVITQWRSNRTVGTCPANTSCNYNPSIGSGWTKIITLQAGQPVTFWLGVVPPDLVIRNSTNGTSPPIDGPTTVACNASATYFARTRNIGRATSSSSVTRASAPGSTNSWDNFNVGSLSYNNSSGIHSYTTSWTSAGTKTVTFTADVNGSIVESLESNNTATLNITVSACVVPKPDLVIRNSTNGTSPPIDGPTNAPCGSLVSYTARTRNIGSATAGSSTTRASTTGSSNNSDNFSVGSLSSNTSSATHTFKTSWSTTGIYWITFFADNTGSVAESIENNNSALLGVSVTCAPPKPDLTIRNSSNGTSPSIDGPDDDVPCGVLVTYIARTRNIGDGTAGASVTRASAPGSSNISDTYPVGSLAINNSSGLHFFTTSWATDGNKTVTFTADVNGSVSESNEGNNSVTLPVEVECPEPEPDLIVESISSTPKDFRLGTIEAGEEVFFEGVIRNIGNVNTGITAARFCIDNQLGCYTNTGGRVGLDLRTDPFLSDGLGGFAPQTIYASTFWKPLSDTGYTITMCADVPGPRGVATEIDDSLRSNCRTESFNVAAATPDPWLQTTGGDVGSFSDIAMVILPPGGQVNADYLVIADAPFTINNFSSDGWIINKYGNLTIEPAPSPNIYLALLDRYGNSASNISGQLNNGNIAGNPVIQYQGFLNNIQIVNYSGPPAIIFVGGNMLVDTTDSITIAPNSGLIFVVGGNILIHKDVTRIDGMFITNEEFMSRDIGNLKTCDPNPTNNNDQLVVNGAVMAFTELCFTRNLKNNDNATIPAELINYEPKYLYLFGDIVGDPTVIYREIAP